MDTVTRLQIERWSAQAVRLLSNGMLMEAAETWRKALQAVMPFVLESSSESLQLPVAAIDAFPMERANAKPDSPPSNDRIFTVFPHVLLYRHRENNTRTSSATVLRRLAASTLYNIGLTHHLQGLRGASHRQHFDKALRAYNASQELLHSTIADAVGLSGDVSLLALAIVNNVGHIQEQAFFEVDRARDCLRQLHCILSFTTVLDDYVHFRETAVLFTSSDEVYLHAPVA